MKENIFEIDDFYMKLVAIIGDAHILFWHNDHQTNEEITTLQLARLQGGYFLFSDNIATISAALVSRIDLFLFLYIMFPYLLTLIMTQNNYFFSFHFVLLP